MLPEISIGPLTIQTFGLMMALGFLTAGWIAHKRFNELGKPPDWAYEIVFVAAIGGLLGAKIDFLIQNPDVVNGDLLGSIFDGSGLVWFGGVVGGVVAAVIWALWRRTCDLPTLDLAAPALAAGYAVGRIGCQLAGDGDYGIPWDGPWAMSYENGTVPTPPGVTVHPTPIYETLIMGAVAFGLWKLRDTFVPGILFAIYAICAGLERFLIEFIRINDHVALGLSQAQFFGLGMILFGVIWITVALAKGPLLRNDAENQPPA